MGKYKLIIYLSISNNETRYVPRGLSCRPQERLPRPPRRDVPNKESMYGNDWDKYKHTRQLMVDCDIYESENWLGTGKCKYSWECRGARMCEGQGWCYGDDACEEVHE